eukprot:CAMPEP_0116091214 /NCGR_PEP_ID=MMETSP0327-20121206/7387_1 /TAXON_ID=44447 /ORGANISM="Pseudo-nitzschia delicatissima, Strain B596" /LENGTH=74 /DNA_ID=CAMNT_0003582553 /DNA_START=148 /DNA_END=368 /DNA_ORIENTATION=+
MKTSTILFVFLIVVASLVSINARDGLARGHLRRTEDQSRRNLSKGGSKGGSKDGSKDGSKGGSKDGSKDGSKGG